MTYHERHAKNEDSRNSAQNFREHWSPDEVDLLLTWDRTDDELTTMAEILGRTREACRERFYLELRRPVKTVTRTTRTVTNYYANWDPDDVSPWYK